MRGIVSVGACGERCGNGTGYGRMGDGARSVWDGGNRMRHAHDHTWLWVVVWCVGVSSCAERATLQQVREELRTVKMQVYQLQDKR